MRNLSIIPAHRAVDHAVRVEAAVFLGALAAGPPAAVQLLVACQVRPTVPDKGSMSSPSVYLFRLSIVVHRLLHGITLKCPQDPCCPRMCLCSELVIRALSLLLVTVAGFGVAVKPGG